MTDAQFIAASAPPRRWTVWLAASGIAFAVVGSLAGLYAKHSADIASFLASQPKRLIGVSSSSGTAAQVALVFDPSSAHHVAPNYTFVWLAAVVVLVGLAAAAIAVAVALRTNRTA